ncbi:glycine betaine ABC transporter substrate-binding protein [Thiohalophilus thiocyanatoxydans]|uniref:glycine betaine ABC transporter substrate-binding protein n=1 Tax=Thiohalophilus thiocyanatoxydans TaxID=381308 RepID=UPI001065AD8D|nr:glycine betaine ABC transporter substrate-binding protein [Thiohalophilus thiocyanatoxydans]
MNGAVKAILLLLVLFAAPGVYAEKPIRIGWTAWSSTEAVMNIAREVLEGKMGYTVEPVMADIGIQYQGVARGDIDVMLMAWLPVTHKPYWDRFAGELVDLGPIYLGARLGWAVPGYIPKTELRSIEDLAKPEVVRKLRGEIQGIDPGSGLMQASEAALEAYGLDDYKLISASGAGMTAALQRAARSEQWIVVTAWNPHWMFARWELRYLEDPRGVLGGKERVHALVRPGFYQDYPDEVTGFLTRFHLPLEDVETVMLEASDSSYEEAAEKYVRTHPRQVRYWVSGTFVD